MPITTLINPAAGWKAAFLQARTDTAGSAVDDADGEDARLVLEAFSAGIVAPAAAFQVVEDSPPAMFVVVGSGAPEVDVAILQGTAIGQGKYIIRNQDATTDVAITAADASNPRIDEIYLVVQDNQYDSTSRVLPRIGYRSGDPAASPAAPGPDAAWDAFLLLATISVPASDTSIENAQITDGRVSAASLVDASVHTHLSTAEGGVLPDHGANHAPGGTDEISEWQVARADYNGTSAGLTGSWVDKASAVFTKPAAWAAALIYVQARLDITYISGTGVDAQARIEVGGDVKIFALMSDEGGPRTTEYSGEYLTRVTGSSTTVALAAIENSGSFSSDEHHLMFIAVESD